MAPRTHVVATTLVAPTTEMAPITEVAPITLEASTTELSLNSSCSKNYRVFQEFKWLQNLSGSKKLKTIDCGSLNTNGSKYSVVAPRIPVAPTL